MGCEFRADKLKKPKNILIMAQIVSFLIYRVGQKSVYIRWVLDQRRVLYERVVALQMAYCTYLFDDSVVKI